MKIGRFEIYPILDGFFRLDGGAMFGRVPKEMWKKNNPADRQNRILLALRCLLIQSQKNNILIDTGIGDKYNQKFIRRFAIDRQFNLDSSLSQRGLSREDIDIVINTHLHFDHCGGNTRIKNQQVIPTFPNAKYLIQKGEWEEARSGNLLTKASYYKDDFLPLEDYGLVEFIKEEIVEVESGITLLRTGGHTKNHMIVKIEAAYQTVFYLADLIPTVSHLNYPFVMAYDTQPLETVKKKIEILSEVAENQSLLIFEHEPKFDAAFIEIKDKKIFTIQEVKF